MTYVTRDRKIFFSNYFKLLVEILNLTRFSSSITYDLEMFWITAKLCQFLFDFVWETTTCRHLMNNEIIVH